MEIRLTPEEQTFRAQVRDWLHDNLPAEERPTDWRGWREFDLAWQKTQYEGGWAGIAWPKEYGGRGLTLLEQVIWFEECARVKAPHRGVTSVGINHGGPTLITRGTEAQKQFHLPRILQGDVVWCQGFSEPNAGSDLAGLTTRAEIDGDHLVVNGSKIWTSYAHMADYQELLVRTDPDAPKHKGITWVICHMDYPGIEVRPIMTMVDPEDFHFCQVFYNDVRIPIANVVGEINDGWNVANATLGFERGTGFISDQVYFAQLVEDMIEMVRDPARRAYRTADETADILGRLAVSRSEMAAIRAMTYATVSRAAKGVPGLEGSMIRLYFSEAQQKALRLAMDILGPVGLERGNMHSWTRHYLRAFASTIAAGSSDVQRNIIGERILGLPKGPKAA
jgi:alkylation response protein AidB-like acyl-CoA dehydrogenase